jgi:hypothetical protein
LQGQEIRSGPEVSDSIGGAEVKPEFSGETILNG